MRYGVLQAQYLLGLLYQDWGIGSGAWVGLGLEAWAGVRQFIGAVG